MKTYVYKSFLFILFILSIAFFFFCPRKIAFDSLINIIWCYSLLLFWLDFIPSGNIKIFDLELPLIKVLITGLLPIGLFFLMSSFHNEITRYFINMKISSEEDCFVEKFDAKEIKIFAQLHPSPVTYEVENNNFSFSLPNVFWGDSLKLKIEKSNCFLLKDTTIFLKRNWIRSGNISIKLPFSEELFFAIHEEKTIFPENFSGYNSLGTIDSILNSKKLDLEEFERIIDEKNINYGAVKMIKERYILGFKAGECEKKLFLFQKKLDKLESNLSSISLKNDKKLLKKETVLFTNQFWTMINKDTLCDSERVTMLLSKLEILSNSLDEY